MSARDVVIFDTAPGAFTRSLYVPDWATNADVVVWPGLDIAAVGPGSLAGATRVRLVATDPANKDAGEATWRTLEATGVKVSGYVAGAAGTWLKDLRQNGCITLPDGTVVVGRPKRTAKTKGGPSDLLQNLRERRASRERPRVRLRPLVSDLLDAGTVFFISGKPGHGKSHVVVDLGCSIATGTPFVGRDVVAGPVVFLVGEGEGSFLDRVQAWERLRFNGQTVPFDALMVLPGAEDLRDPDSDVARDVVQAVTEVNPSAVFIDTLNKYTAGVDENSSGEMGAFLKVAERIKNSPSSPAVGIVHHTNKSSEELRGSSALHGAADTVLHSKKGDDDRFQVSAVKQRNRAEGPVGAFGLEAVAWTDTDADGEELEVESVVARWDVAADETNHVPVVRELDHQGVNLPKLSLENAVLATIAAKGEVGMTLAAVVTYLQEARRPRPEKNKVERAFSRVMERKDVKPLQRVRSTERFRIRDGVTLPEKVQEAAEFVRQEWEQETPGQEAAISSASDGGGEDD